MGYTVSGSIDVAGPPDLDIAAALDLDRLRTALGEDLRVHRDEPDLVPRLLRAAGFDVWGHTGEGQSRCYNGGYDGKWYTSIEDVLEFLAQHGYRVEASFRGEDDSIWRYTSAKNALVEMSQVVVGSDEVATAATNAAMIEQIEAAAAIGEPDALFAAKVRAILADGRTQTDLG